MKIIDLLNKIANGEAPENIRYKGNDYYLFDSKSYITTDKTRFFDMIYFKNLNDEVKIIEKNNEIKKLPYYSLKRIQKTKNKDEWREERIRLLEKRIDDYHKKINEIIDKVNKLGE